jgi:ABC-type nitrate/sulfonate/bicarbonate transport system substrate-binding protein
MADYGVDVYGNAIIVNPKFATDHPDAVKGFLRAFVKSLKSTAQDPAAAVDSVVKRNEVAKKDVELERLNMALHDNILTPQARAVLRVQGAARKRRHLRFIIAASRADRVIDWAWSRCQFRQWPLAK